MVLSHADCWGGHPLCELGERVAQPEAYVPCEMCSDGVEIRLRQRRAPEDVAVEDHDLLSGILGSQRRLQGVEEPRLLRGEGDMTEIFLKVDSANLNVGRIRHRSGELAETYDLGELELNPWPERRRRASWSLAGAPALQGQFDAAFYIVGLLDRLLVCHACRLAKRSEVPAGHDRRDVLRTARGC